MNLIFGTRSTIYTSLAFSVLLTGCSAFYAKFYTDPVKCLAIANDRKPYDVLIVPGFPFDSGKIDDLVGDRIAWAAYLYKNGYAKHVIFSGSAVHSPYVEAEAMRLYALRAGIKPEDIFTETNAKHTTENLYYSFLLAEKLGFTKKAFASQPVQTSSMKNFSEKRDLPVDFIPILTDTLKKYPLPVDSIDISGAVIANFVSLKDREGLIKRLRGTRGHAVKVAMRKVRKLERKARRDLK
jgi:uncharacterized SAM-binding protein YcdF (DUF218 family)